MATDLFLTTPELDFRLTALFAVAFAGEAGESPRLRVVAHGPRQRVRRPRPLPTPSPVDLGLGGPGRRPPGCALRLVRHMEWYFEGAAAVVAAVVEAMVAGR